MRGLKLKIIPRARRRSYFSLFALHLSLQRGYVALTTVLFVLAASVAVIGGLTFFSFQEAAANRLFVKSIDARAIAEAGIEDALLRVMSGMSITSSETLGVGKGTTTVTVTTLGNTRIIRSSANRDALRQNIVVLTDISSENLGLQFGVQIGDGGLKMGQNSSVIGGVFSNGSIIGESGAVITGNAFAAGMSSIIKVMVDGDAQAHFMDDSSVGGYASSTTKLDDVIVGKDAHANELDDAIVNKDAYYNVIDGTSVVLGASHTPAIPPSDLAPLPLPIAASTIDQWKSDAEAKGVIASGGCGLDWSPPVSPYTVGGGVLERNLKLGTGKILVLKGTVWVKCSVDVDTGAAIQLDSSYGASSGVMIADGWMHFKNNGAFQGSGHPCGCSYLMLLTTASGGGHHNAAIDLHNNATGAIFYAGNGMIYLHPNVTVTQLTGRTVHLENNAKLIYELGVASAQFSPGSSGGYDIKYWKEAE